MGLSSAWIIIHYLLLFPPYIGATATQDTTADVPPPANLGDREDYNPWEPCGAGELCVTKRTHKCTNSSTPHISCGSVVWKEELLGCYVCAQNLWQDDGDWSKCVGVGCKGTVQSFSRTCANKAVNPNCNLVQTRYCDASNICDGEWGSWTTDSAKCQDQCGQLSRIRVMQRTCMKNGKPSSSCTTPTPSTPLVDTLIDHCTASPCPTTTDPPQTTTSTTAVSTTPPTTTTTTTTATTTTASTTSTTTTPTVTLSPWSEWKGCTATCKNLQGTERRTRKCTDQDGNESSPASCGGETLTEERNCELKNAGECKKTTKLTTTDPTTSKTTTDSTTKTVVSNKSGGGGRNAGIPEPEATTAANASINSTSALSQESALLRNEHKILIIVLVITCCLIAIVLIIYMYLIKRKKRRDKKSTALDISIVGLQSHTGFMEGMEKYGFTKSTVPVGDIFSAINPMAPTGSTATPAKMDDIQQRELPQKPLDYPFEETNPNPSHIYEDMRLTSSEHDLLSPATPLMRRSLSYHEKMHRNQAYTLNVQDMQARRSLRLPAGYKRRKSLAPPKPPRRFTMTSNGNERYVGSETKEVPKYLYGSKEKAKLPDLGFINHINPPLYSPPISSPEETKSSLTIPNLAAQAHSAPASPNAKYGAHIPHSPFLTPVILPYNGMQFMAPVQSQNGGVVYMPFSPVYPPSPSFQMGQPLQGTPLHGTEVVLRHNSKKAQRPKTMSFVPQISISEADSHLLSPNNSIKSPLSGEYTVMQHSRSPSVPPDFEDADLMLARTKSFTHLHGTQNASPSNIEQSDENSNKVPVAAFETPEDSDGYLLPTKV